MVQEFEERFAARCGVKHAIAVNSATAALHLALEAYNIGPGDEVVVPTYTFAACGEVIAYLGAKIVLSDVDEDYLLATCESSERTKAVMPVHFAGRVVNIKAPVPIIEDAAHCIPGPLRGQAAAYSFYATKTLTTGEGGMLVTDDDGIAARARRMRLHGIDADAWNRYGPGNKWAYQIGDAGFKYNLTDIAAAIGIVQLERQAELLAKRMTIAARYKLGLADVVGLPPESESWHLFVIKTPHRDRVVQTLALAGIGASVHFIPLHLHPYYRRLGYQEGDFPVAERLFAESVSLPIWPDMTDDEVEAVIATVKEAA